MKRDLGSKPQQLLGRIVISDLGGLLGADGFAADALI
jgi:hypothetical protein